MILTVTPNPSVDRTVFVDGLPRGAVIRSHRSRSEPSGKGVNVALALRAHEHDVVAVLPAGGFVGAQLVELLHAAGMTHVSVPITGDIRSNISLVEPTTSTSQLRHLWRVRPAGQTGVTGTDTSDRSGRARPRAPTGAGATQSEDDGLNGTGRGTPAVAAPRSHQEGAPCLI